MAAATVWPALIHYSTDARGYSLIALAFLGLILLGEELIEGGGTAICVAIAVVVTIGMYTAPVMLYPAGAALSWIIVEQFRRARSPGVRALLPKLITTVVVAAALTLIAYAPVLVRSGAGVLLRNRYVVALGLGEFVAALPGFAGELRESLGLGISIPLLGVVALLAIAGVAWPRDGLGSRSALALSVLGWCAFLLLATRRPPPGRVWLFLVPLGLAYAGTGLALGVRRVADMRRTDVRAVSAVVALFVAAALAIGIVRGRAVLRTPETGSLADAPEIASYLLARLHPGDRVVVKNPCDHPLDYYLLRRGRRRLQEINAQAGAGRVFVVVEPRHLQTLEAVQQSAPDLPWPELSLAAPVDTFPSARVYTYGFAAPP
jgi:hypothetical protein